LDLFYAISIHGHERVATKAGLRVERRGLTKGRLTEGAIRSAILAADGMQSPPPPTMTATTASPAAASGAVRATEIVRHLKGSFGISVSLGHVNATLSRMAAEGRLVLKLDHGLFALKAEVGEL
jgi:hypothetical protein